MSLTVYKSSAGSGKTFTLVREYIGIVMKNPADFRHILAITFTNKAANEMKTRILTMLAGMAYGPRKDDEKMLEVLKSYLKQQTGLDDDLLRQRAGIVLQNILHGYSNFAVSTIDSFVHRLVRNFARELELPLNFDVEMDQDKLITKSIEMLLSRVGSDPGLTKTLVRFVESKMDDEKSWDVERELKQITKVMLQESSVGAVQRIMEMDATEYLEISRKLSQMISRVESELAQIGKDALQMINSKGVEPQDFYYGSTTIHGYFRKLSIKDFRDTKPKKRMETMFETGNWISGKCSAASASAIEELKPALTVMVKKVSERIPELNLCRLIYQNIYPIAVMSEIGQVMQDFRDQENIVHISEFNKRISAIIGSEPVPFIYERTGEKYHHFLVDEFQDTSVLQWQNLLPLFENSLAANHFNMIVGDGKQAIYRWRNGEVEQFAALPKIYNKPGGAVAAMREQLLVQHFDERFLRQNYRSAKEVVEFNNEFFAFASGRLPEHLKPIYHELSQEVDPDRTGGRVELEFLDLKDLSGDEKLEPELDNILERVGGFHEAEGYRLNEITVLTRTNDHASCVARHLVENGIPVVTSEALVLSASPEVRFIVDNLRYLNEPDDPGVVAGMLVFLLKHRKQPVNKLHKMLLQCEEIHPGKPGTKPLADIIHENFDVDAGWHRIRQYNLYEMTAMLVETFDLNSCGNHPFIRFFMDTVLDFSATNEENIADFLEYWEETGSLKSIVIPEETDAVRVMTIHKAKGLQFPVVIYPFASGNNKLGKDEVWIEPEINEIPELKMALVKTSKLLGETKFAHVLEQEEHKSFLDHLNVLYVAMTRPKERLVVLLHDKHNNKGIWNEGKTFPDAADLFYDFLQSKGLWNNDSPKYIFGFEGRCVRPSQPEKQDQSGEPVYKKGSWRSGAALRYRAGKTWDLQSTEQNRDYGIMLHNILASVKTKEDVKIAVHEAVVEGTLNADLKSKLESEVYRVITSPELARFFDPGKKIFTEKEIILGDGTLLRPDRIVMDDQETSVIDYKTGGRHDQHKEQVDEYAGSLASMGYPNIRKYLVYLNMAGKSVDVVEW